MWILYKDIDARIMKLMPLQQVSQADIATSADPHRQDLMALSFPTTIWGNDCLMMQELPNSIVEMGQVFAPLKTWRLS